MAGASDRSRSACSTARDRRTSVDMAGSAHDSGDRALESTRAVSRWLFLAVVAAVAAAAHLLLPLAPYLELHRSSPDTAWLLVTEIRLPRTLLALGYGAVLGMTGAALQAIFANPLASPDITGSSSGAALGAVFGAYWLGLTSPLAL